MAIEEERRKNKGTDEFVEENGLVSQLARCTDS